MIPRRTSLVLAAAATLVLSACGASAGEAEPLDSVPASSDTTESVVTEPTVTDTTVLSAAEGAEARRQRPAHGGAADLASSSSSASGECGGIAAPGVDDVEAFYTDIDALVAVFERFAIPHTATTDDFGYPGVEYDDDDPLARSVAESFWVARYPDEGPTPVDDEPFDELVEIEFPAPTDDDLERQASDNKRLATAFDAAGIEYQVLSDELGWEWLEWDYDDPDLIEPVTAIFNEIAGVDDVPFDSCVVVDVFGADEGIGDGQPLDADGETPLDRRPPSDEPPILDTDSVEVEGDDSELDELVVGLDAAGVTNEIRGFSPWRVVVFDLDNVAAVDVVAEVLMAR